MYHTQRTLVPFYLIVAVYFSGMGMDIMDVDAAQYASMAREMLESGEYLKLYNRQKDYLDKPPLLFWLSALSFKFFGVSNFAYRLPSVLFTLLGLWSTYKLGSVLYNKKVGYYAALMLGSSQAWFLINHDVRTDTILAACTVFGIWQSLAFSQKGNYRHLVYAALGIAGAMLTKGPIGLMVPALALGTFFLAKGDWKSLFKWQWLLMLVWIGVFISPFLYGLYQQFDLHPGKVINGMIIDSGVKFYLWTQSFGRLTGENAWKDDSGVFYFTHTFLWSFLPWSMLYVTGIIDQVRCLVFNISRRNGAKEWLTIGGVIVPFIAFSLSQYKLPHYIYVVFPLMAITSARFAVAMMEFEFSPRSLWKYINKSVFILFLACIPVLLLLLCLYSFPGMKAWLWAAFVIGFTFVWYIALRSRGFERSLINPVLYTVVLANFILNMHVYPSLLRYQSYTVAARDVYTMGISEASFFTWTESLHSIDFYSRRIVPDLLSFHEVDSIAKLRTVYLYTNEDRYNEIIATPGYKVQTLKTYDHFHVTTLTLPFLMPSTRQETVRKRYLLKITREQ